MRRSICYCEPNCAYAGMPGTWKFIYTTSTQLPKGTVLRFDILSNGRDVDWEVPNIDPEASCNTIFGLLDDGTILHPKEIEFAEKFTPMYEFVLPQDIEVGGNFKVCLGSPSDDKHTYKTHGTKSQCHAQRRRVFHLYIDTTGKKKFDDPELFNLDVKGNELKEIKILAPSLTGRNKRFDVIVRFEDAYGNLTSNAPEDTLIELSHEHLRENLNWKLFVPETGFLTLPNLYFNEAGVYTIQLKNLKTNQVYRSSPIKCFNETDKSLYWGLLHGESEKFDSTENIENCLCHIRDEKGLNFFASSPFDAVEEISNDQWKQVSQSVDDFSEADRFVTLIGFQWQGQNETEGLRLMLYPKDSKPIMRSKDPKYNSLKKIYKSLNPKDLLSIPSFTMGKGMEYDFIDFDKDFERLVEIYNAWGSSECTEKEGNPWPIKGKGKDHTQETAVGSIQKALNQNKRFGFVAGGLDDRGPYGGFFDNNQNQYWPGMTAVFTKDLSRASIFDALYNRSCYATTGEKIVLGFTIAGSPMGSETSTEAKPGLLFNRHISGYAACIEPIEKIEIIRNGKILHTISPENELNLDFTYDDMVPLEDVAIDAKDDKPPFVYYYLRVYQKDGHMAWSSPIWVDFLKVKPVRKKSSEDTEF